MVVKVQRRCEGYFCLYTRSAPEGSVFVSREKYDIPDGNEYQHSHLSTLHSNLCYRDSRPAMLVRVIVILIVHVLLADTP